MILIVSVSAIVSPCWFPGSLGPAHTTKEFSGGFRAQQIQQNRDPPNDSPLEMMKCFMLAFKDINEERSDCSIKPVNYVFI